MTSFLETVAAIVLGILLTEVIQTRPECDDWNRALYACSDEQCGPRIRASRPAVCKEYRP